MVTVLAQEALPPLPSELPVSAPSNPQPVRRITPAPAPQRQIGLQFPTRATNAARPAAYQPRTVGEDMLKWDETAKEYTMKPGEVNAPFVFTVTNVATTNVTINWVRPSCGCTIAKLPATPWTIKPGEGGTIAFDVDVKGKYGVLSKYVSIDTSEGQKLLSIRVNIPQIALAQAQPGMDSRESNLQLAMADRQIVFRGDCASCHATPTIGRMGEQLYHTACAICHDAPHRATMVPDLHALRNATDKDYWAHWIANGKPGTLMPGFAKAHGGPLSDAQIQSLAAWMFETFPRAEKPATPAAAAPPEPKVTPLNVPGTLSISSGLNPAAP